MSPLARGATGVCLPGNVRSSNKQWIDVRDIDGKIKSRHWSGAASVCFSNRSYGLRSCSWTCCFYGEFAVSTFLVLNIYLESLGIVAPLFPMAAKRQPQHRLVHGECFRVGNWAVCTVTFNHWCPACELKGRWIWLCDVSSEYYKHECIVLISRFPVSYVHHNVPVWLHWEETKWSTSSCDL